MVESCLGEAHAKLTSGTMHESCAESAHYHMATVELHAAVVDAAVGYLTKGQKVNKTACYHTCVAP